MLETLCLRAISSDPALLCVEKYFACVDQHGLTLPTNMDKARIHAFLASRPAPDLLVGQAAHKSYWLWDNPVWDDLKGFLRSL